MAPARLRPAAALAALLLAAPAAAETPAGEDDFPRARAAVRLALAQAGDAALAAQERHFPEHYDAMVGLLVAYERGGRSDAAREALAAAALRHWERYNELVRRGDPADWRGLVERRRELFALIGRHDGAALCRAYEMQGAPALARSGRAEYRAPVDAYIAAFIEAAARARAAPREQADADDDDFARLRAAMEARGAGPERLAALRPELEAAPEFCAAMLDALDAALAMDPARAAALWRFLVTRPGREQPPQPQQEQ